MRRLLPLLVALALVLSLSGSALASEPVLKMKVGYAPPNTTEVFRSAGQFLELAVIDAAKHGVEIELITIEPTKETNFEEQVNALENMLAQGCDAIVCSPGSAETLNNVFREINEANIPLVLFNIVEPPEGIKAHIVGFSNLEAGVVTGYATVDYYGGPGVLGAGEMVEVSPETPLDREWWEALYADFDWSSIPAVKLGVISGIAGTIYSLERDAGYHEIIDKCQNITVAATLNGDWDRSTSLAAAENILQSHPDLDAFFGMCAESEMACISAVEAANVQENCKVFGNDGTIESLQAIADGKIVAETWHGFPEWGWYGMETAVKLHLGLETPMLVDINPRTVYSGNVEVFQNMENNLVPIDWEGILTQAGLKK